MKKILLSLSLISLGLMGKAQTVLNELYTDPAAGNSEFIELFNSSTSLIPQNLDCFTIVTYYEFGNGNNTTKGFYVIDIPNLSVASKSYFVLASSNPFNVQSQTNVAANVNWNDAAGLAANNGFLRNYQLNAAGTGYLPHSTPASLNDFLAKRNGNGGNYIVMLFQNGVLINGFIGGANNGNLAADITSLPDLTIVGATACSNVTIDFSALGAFEFVIATPGNDNGYSRDTDGQCGTWNKNAPSPSHTPGVTNGGTTAVGSLVTTELLQCNSPIGVGKSTVRFDITGVSGVVTEADDFPVEVQLYYDVAPVGLSALDVYYGSKLVATVAAASDTFQIVQNLDILLVYKTKRGCFDKVVTVDNTCLPLPVTFKSFTATRQSSNVVLRWETSMEQNNSGFAVERNVNGTWQQIAWIPSQAQFGNSDAPLAYSYVDFNTTRGVSQYRIRQVDLDAKAKYTEIRSVRGEGQLGNTIVYPNPSNDGKVNIVFEGAAGNRDIAVSDMSGRIVKQLKAITNNNITIDNLQPGMYMVRIVDTETGAQVVEKIVVNKR